MECNKDEALRARCMSERKFLQHDLVGAKKFALKAQCLFPDLEGLPQLIAVLDVHIVAQQKFDGAEVNWYGILQTDASADEATIRKQYRKLALILHPDKNKAVGAEGAFKLISEAWRVLSDKEKKAVHDAKRMVKSNNSSGSSAMRRTKGFCNFTHFSAWCQPRPGDKKSSFWTACPSCKMQLEYLRVHQNKKISCPTCGKFFTATEIQASGRASSSQPSEHIFKEAGTNCSEKQPQTDKGRPKHMGSSFISHWGNLRYTAANQTAAAKTTAEVVQEMYEAVRRERVKAQKEAREKAVMERMEAEKEARRREHRDRKQKRKQEEQERLAKMTACDNGSFEEVLGMEPMHVNGSESRRARSVGFMPTEMVASSSRRVGSVSFMPTEDVESGMGHISPHDSTNGTQELGSCIRERVARFDHVQEPSRCRMINSFESTNSYDSSDVFSFSKRLKVDV